MVEYTMNIYSASGTPLGIITDFSEIQIAGIVNGYDVLNCTVKYSSPYTSYLVQGNVVEVYLQNTDIGITSHLVFSGFIQGTSFTSSQQKQWSIVAFGYEHILSYRVIAWDEAIENVTQWNNVYASTIIDNNLDKNFRLGSQTVGVGGRAVDGYILGFPTVNQLGIGNQLSISGVPYNNCLTAIQNVATQGNIDFSLTRTYYGGMNFLVGSPILGTDRTDSVVFSIEADSISSLTVSYDYTQYANTAIVRGYGSENSVVRVVRPATPLTGLSMRETFVDDSPSGNNTVLLSATGDLALSEIALNTRTVDVQVIQQPQVLYGKHYFLGDLVSVDIGDDIIPMLIHSVRLSFNSSGVESVNVELNDE